MQETARKTEIMNRKRRHDGRVTEKNDAEKKFIIFERGLFDGR